MKSKQAFLFLALALGVGYVVLNSSGFSAVLGTSTTNKESQEVCWYNTKPAEKYQLFFGQESTGVKDSAIYEGLENRSKCVKLSYLKPCTTYIWNLLRRESGKWDWIYESDQKFVTGGTCESAPATSSVPVNVVQGNATATVSWTTTSGATGYHLYYRLASDPNWSYAVSIPANSTSYTINYLNPNAAYMYRVAALVNGKMVWQAEKNLVVTK